MSRIRRLFTVRPWLTTAVVIVVIAAGTGAYLLTRTSSSSASTQARTATRLVAVSTGSVEQSVSATGTFAPADEEDVSFGSAAEVTSVRVSVGQKVTKGQVLGTIDTLELKSTLAQARASLADAEATLDSAEDSDSTTPAQLSADKLAVSTAKSAVTAAKSALAGATLRSPIAGTIAEVNIAKGDRSSGSSSAGSGGSGSSGGAGGGSATGGGASTSSSSSGADFVVVGLKKWTVSASLDDTQVGLVSKGDQVTITTDNVSGTVFGTLSSVSVLSSSSSSSSGSASYPITIAVTGSPSGLHDGASATAAIIYRKVSNVLTVPTAAVHTANGTSYVFVSANGKQTKTTVTTGLSSGGTTQVKSGLTSGQQVVVQTAVGTGNSGSSNSNNSNTNRNRFGGGGGNFVPGGGNFPGGGNRPGGGGFGGGGR